MARSQPPAENPPRKGNTRKSDDQPEAAKPQGQEQSQQSKRPTKEEMEAKRDAAKAAWREKH